MKTMPLEKFQTDNAEAAAYLARAKALRDEASELEARANAILRRENSSKNKGLNLGHRPPVEGMPSLSINRLIRMMEKLGIDEDVSCVDGLDYPLGKVEQKLGISYGRFNIPYIGARIRNCEEKMTGK